MPLVTFSVKQPTTDPVDNALVRVYDTSDVEIGQGFTNAAGKVDFLLPDGDYRVRYRYDGEAYRVVSPQSFTVSGVTIIVNLELTILDKPVATHPRLCRVYGDFLMPSGLAALTPVRLAIQAPYMFLDEAFIGAHVDFVPDEHGRVERDTLRNRDYTLIYGRFSDTDETIHIPNRSSAKFSDVFYPVPFSFTPDTKAMAVGDKFPVGDLAVLMSNDVEQNGSSEYLSYVSSDDAVVLVSGSYLVAVGIGLATVTMLFADLYHDEFTVGELSITVA